MPGHVHLLVREPTAGIGLVPQLSRRVLQPPLSAGDARRFDAIGGAELADRFRQIIPHRAFRQIQFGGDVGAGHAFSCEAQHLALALGERIGLVGPRLGSELRIDDAQPLCTRRTASASCSAGMSLSR